MDTQSHYSRETRLEGHVVARRHDMEAGVCSSRETQRGCEKTSHGRRDTMLLEGDVTGMHGYMVEESHHCREMGRARGCFQ
jgi:hypothetical protein